MGPLGIPELVIILIIVPFVAFIVRDGIKGSREAQQDDPIVYDISPNHPPVDQPLTTTSWSTPRRMLQILVIAFFSSFLVLLSINHPRWNWANCIGCALATIIFAVIIASVFIGLRMLFTDYQPPYTGNKLLAFIGALAIPLLFISPIVIIYQYDFSSRDAEDARELDRMLRSANN
jgi:hypothetical protein